MNRVGEEPIKSWANPETGTKDGHSIRQLVYYIDTIKTNLGHIEDAIEEVRNQEFKIEDVRKDTRYSIQIMLKEYERLSLILDSILDTEIVSEELTSRLVKL